MGLFDKVKSIVSKKEHYPEIPPNFPLPSAEKKLALGLPPTPFAPEEPIKHELPPTEEPTFGLPTEEKISLSPPGFEAPSKPIEYAFPERQVIKPGTPLPPPEELVQEKQMPSYAIFEIIKGKLDILQAKIEKIEHQLDMVLSLQKTQTSGKYF